jgi:hypothetical protein
VTLKFPDILESSNPHPMSNEAKKAIAIRLDEKVSGWLRKATGAKGLAHHLQRDFGQRDAEGRVKILTLQETVHILRQSYRRFQYEDI